MEICKEQISERERDMACKNRVLLPKPWRKLQTKQQNFSQTTGKVSVFRDCSDGLMSIL